ncbi:MAG: hypothetical protein NZO16_00250 [Deltaproteobacteria bacterium]|nr:hypothetical protein [Deltaproteobacteria bacterium]
MGKGCILIRLLLIVSLIFLERVIADDQNFRVKNVVLLIKENEDQPLKIARHLVENGIETKVHVSIRNTDYVERILNKLGAGSLKKETVLKFILTQLLIAPNPKFDKASNERISDIQSETIKKILLADPAFSHAVSVFQNFSLSFAGDNFDLKLSPTWLIDTDRGQIILEGYKGDILKYLDLEKKIVRFAKLSQELNHFNHNHTLPTK